MRILDWSSDVCSSDLSALRYQGAMLGFAAGVMLAASFFSLIVPAVGILDRQGVGSWPAAGTVAVAVLVGGLLLLALSRFRSEEHTSELQSLMRISYAVFCLKKKKIKTNNPQIQADQTKIKTVHTRHSTDIKRK